MRRGRAGTLRPTHDIERHLLALAVRGVRFASTMPWVYNPHVGGTKIPPKVQGRVRARIVAHATKNYAGRYDRLDVRFRGALCYIDAYDRGSQHPLHLVRLRYFGAEDRWTLAFYTYSHERYDPCAFPDGSFHGTPEVALGVGSDYLE